jgi:hypothetical protein
VYHTCYCVSGLSIAQHCGGVGGSAVNNNDIGDNSNDGIGDNNKNKNNTVSKSGAVKATDPVYNVERTRLRAAWQYWAAAPSL